MVIDTSVIIDHLRQKDKTNTFLKQIANKPDLLKISIITHTELHAGKSVWENHQAKAELDLVLSEFTVISYTKNLSLLAGKLRAKSRLDLGDAIIAATAITENEPLAPVRLLAELSTPKISPPYQS